MANNFDIKYRITNGQVFKTTSKNRETGEKGLTKSIGVSNCNTQVMLDVLAYAKIKPAVNQIEAHPYFQQKDLIDFFRDKFHIHTMAYAPLSSGQFKGKGKEMQSLNILQEKVVTALAQKYEKSAGQIVLNWHLHRGHIIIPKTTNPKRLPENLNCYGFKLTDEEYQSISALEQGARLFNPKNWGGPTYHNIPYLD